MHIDQEQFFTSAFDEIGELMRDDLVKEALGAGLIQGAKTVGSQLLGAGRLLAKNPRGSMQIMRGTYRGAGGGLKGARAVLGTRMGQAAALGAGTAVAAPVAAGYALGRRR